MKEPRPLTCEYQLMRMQLSLTVAQEYVRMFWWALLGVPTFGLLCLLLASDQVLKTVGIFCLLWPITIPARSFLITSRPSRQFLKPTTLLLGDQAVVLKANDKTGMKIDKNWIRSIARRGAVYVVVTRMLGVFLVPFDAFLSDADRTTFEELATRKR